MWQPEVTGSLPAWGLVAKGLFSVANQIHMKRIAPETDTTSSHQCNVRYINTLISVKKKKKNLIEIF